LGRNQHAGVLFRSQLLQSSTIIVLGIAGLERVVGWNENHTGGKAL
jgi:hypothetical protein